MTLAAVCRVVALLTLRGTVVAEALLKPVAPERLAETAGAAERRAGRVASRKCHPSVAHWSRFTVLRPV